MALNSSNTATVACRQALVAKWRVRGLTVREVEKKLAEEGLINPKTGKHFSAASVYCDVKAIEKSWRIETAKTIAEHRARQLAEISELKKAGWQKDELKIVLDSLKTEMDLLGTDAKTAVSIPVVQELKEIPEKIDPVEASRIYQNLMRGN